MERVLAVPVVVSAAKHTRIMCDTLGSLRMSTITACRTGRFTFLWSFQTYPGK